MPLGGEAKVLLKMSKANAEYGQYKESEGPHRDSEIPLCCRKYRHCEARIFMYVKTGLSYNNLTPRAV